MPTNETAPPERIHWPFTAKHDGCAECDRDYEPPPPREAALAAAQRLDVYISNMLDRHVSPKVEDITKILLEYFPDQSGEAATCLMADCDEPQGHFCFQHTVEVFVPKAHNIQDRAREILTYTRDWIGDNDYRELHKRITATLIKTNGNAGEAMRRACVRKLRHRAAEMEAQNVASQKDWTGHTHRFPVEAIGALNEIAAALETVEPEGK